MKKIIIPIVAVLGLSACQQDDKPTTPVVSDANIAQLIPSRVKNRPSWAGDISQIFDELGIHKDKENICTVIAVIDQESNFNANPAVPNLGEASLKAIDDKLEDKLGKQLAGVFRTMLATRPTKDNNFIKQIKAVKTEKELDELYHEIFDYFTTTYKVSGVNSLTKLTGEALDERLNPITTLGSMQVHISYAKRHRRANMNDRTLRADMYGQYGGLYYGIHRLMKYEAKYDKPLYRFADYNSGVYSSRNAAFQQRVATLTGKKLAIDGDLLQYSGSGVSSQRSQTEMALIELLATAPVPMTDAQIRSDLKKEKRQSFENTKTYQTVNEMFTQKRGRPPSYAIMPQVVISGPKLSQDYNTNWFATRVDRRYQTCMTTAKSLKL
ncbi:MAG: DUF1615 family protein [Moraxella sp.]|nr:DUF1615 family protein [Moraxella sp.]